MAAIDDILKNTEIKGLDIPDAMSRLANNGKIYMRIIHSFIQNMPKLLNGLAAVTEDTMADYSIQVHGAKGSCYGIGAVYCGDLAFELEKASKDGVWTFVTENNGAFIDSVNQLLVDLQGLEDLVEGSTAPAGASASSPDRAKLAALLVATRNYEIETMLKIIEELEAQSYTSGGEIVPWLREQFDSFAYDNTVERLSSL